MGIVRSLGRFISRVIEKKDPAVKNNATVEEADKNEYNCKTERDNFFDQHILCAESIDKIVLYQYTLNQNY